MARKKSAEIVEPAEPMTPAYILPNNELRQIPVSSIVVDPSGMILPSYVEIARAHLFSLRNGSRDWIPKVIPLPGDFYSVIHFETV